MWALRVEPTVQVRLVKDLRLDDFFNDVLQGDDTQNLVERVSLALVVHPLDYGQVGFSYQNKHAHTDAQAQVIKLGSYCDKDG